MNVLKELESEKPNHNAKPVTWEDIKALEKHLDRIWSTLGVDIDFTKHFMERVNDPRNGRQITVPELARIFIEVYRKYGRMIASKVTPDTEKTFDTVLTDLATKVNSPVVVVWDKDKKELKMVAKTVMRVNHFYTHDNQPRLTVQQYEPEGQPITENKMKKKTYTDLKEWLGWDTPEVAPIAAPQAVDDVDNAAFSVEEPDNLDKLNAYCHDIANHQYINPYYPLNTLWRKLSIIGLNFEPKKIMFVGSQGRVEVPLSQFGGRFGVLGGPFDHYVAQDDGISGRIPGGLNLVINYVKTGGVYSLNATIERGANTMGFVEAAKTAEPVQEDELVDEGQRLENRKNRAADRKQAIAAYKNHPEIFANHPKNPKNIKKAKPVQEAEQHERHAPGTVKDCPQCIVHHKRRETGDTISQLSKGRYAEPFHEVKKK